MLVQICKVQQFCIESSTANVPEQDAVVTNNKSLRLVNELDSVQVGRNLVDTPITLESQATVC